MKIKYIGTGGGAGIPEMFCGCRVCENARLHRKYEQRNRSMTIINDELCIDLPCDARSSFIESGVDARKICYLLVTHNHYDHFMEDNLLSRPENCRPIELYISSKSGGKIVDKCIKLRDIPQRAGVRSICYPNVNIVESFKQFVCGEYTVIPLPSNHAREVETLNFIISSQEKNILWLHDTGLILEETVDYLKKMHMHFDFISMDCALAKGKYISNEHMDILQCAETVKTLKLIGCLDENTIIYLSHIGHLVERTHQELLEDAREFGFHVAYDGVVINI